MTRASDMTPSEVAAMDAAFEAGVAEAVKRGSSLLMMSSRIGESAVWVCLYPPAEATPQTVGEWSRNSGLQPADGDLFIDLAGVRRAAADLGLQ